MPNEFRGRFPGESVYYSVEQTERYKSQWMRYQGAQELLRKRDLIFDNGQVKRFRSKRSPVGYWEVSTSSGIDWQPLIIDDAGGIFGGGTTGGVSYTFSKASGKLTASLNISPETADGAVINFFAWGYVDLLAPANCDFKVSATNSSFPGYDDVGNLSVTQVFTSFNTGIYSGFPPSSILDFSEISSNASVLASWSAHPSSDGERGVNAFSNWIPEYPLAPAQYPVVVPEPKQPLIVGETSRPLSAGVENKAVVGILIELYNTSGVGVADSPTYYPGTATCSATIQATAGKSKYCTCPDWQKKADKFPQSPYLSEHIDRNWEESDAGAPDPPRECKHMIAAAIVDDTYEIPIDIKSKLTATEIKNLRPSSQPLKVNSQIKPIKLIEQKLPTLKPRKQKDLIPVTDSIDLGQEIWTGEKRTGVYKGSQRNIDLGEDIDTLPEYEEYLVDGKNRETIDNSINP